MLIGTEVFGSMSHQSSFTSKKIHLECSLDQTSQNLVTAAVERAGIVAEHKPRLIPEADRGLHHCAGKLHTEAVLAREDFVGIPCRIIFSPARKFSIAAKSNGAGAQAFPSRSSRRRQCRPVYISCEARPCAGLEDFRIQTASKCSGCPRCENRPLAKFAAHMPMRRQLFDFSIDSNAFQYRRFQRVRREQRSPPLQIP